MTFRKRGYFATAGEKRKFYRNMEFCRFERGLAFTGMRLIPSLVMVALGVLAFAGIASASASGSLPVASGGHATLLMAHVAVVGGLSKARELRENRAKIVSDAQALIPDKGPITAELRTKFDAMMADAELMKGDIDRIERAEAAAAEYRTAAPPPPANIAKFDPELVNSEYRAALRKASRALLVPGESVREKALSYLSTDMRAEVDKQETRVWQAIKGYLCEHVMPGSFTPEDRSILAGKWVAEVRADMGTGGGNALQGTGGGYFVPVGFVYDVEVAMKWYGQMLESSTIIDTATGQPLPYPTCNDTAVTGIQVDEQGTVTTPTDISLGNVVFNAYKFTSGIINVSIELMQDSAFDFQAFVKDQMAIRLGRVINTKATVGVGTTTLYGIVPASTVGVGGTSGTSVIGDDNANSPAPTVEVGYQDLVNLEHSVNRAYRKGAAYMFADTTLAFVKKLKDKYGHPLWVPGIAVGAPDTILGYKYFINDDMATLTATSPVTARKTVLFGQLSKYHIRRVKELSILRLNERYAEKGQVAFIGFARYDGNLLDAGTHPVKHLVNPAS